jgi:glycosyltransferase involved in cell wall biosynthesis
MSEFETQPIAALEAHALGCRLIVADTPGLRQLAHQGLARSVPLNSAPELIAATILDELQKPPPAKRAPLPTWDECADALLELYEAAARRGPGSASRPLSLGAGV